MVVEVLFSVLDDLSGGYDYYNMHSVVGTRWSRPTELCDLWRLYHPGDDTADC